MKIIALVLAGLVGTASADDGPTLSTALTGSVALGPVPDTGGYERLDLAVGITARHRLHLGAGVGLGNGGQAGLLAEAFGEAGVWLHASARVDLLLGWRLGAARFSIYGMPVHAAMTSSLIELRYRARANLDVVIQPFTLTGYYNGLWAIVAGPALGVAVPW